MDLMRNNRSIVGIITARGGSKGLPGKNMLDVGGRPLIEYTMRLAQACTGLERVFLSTDIPEAIALAREKYPRVEVPYVRPAQLCTDAAGQVEVVQHLLDHVERTEGLRPWAVLLLQPTSPFRRGDEVADALSTFKAENCESMIGVSRVIHHPADYLYRPDPRSAEFAWVMRSEAWSRRQDFPEVWFNTGALYICRAEYLQRHRRFYDSGSYVFRMAEESALDIDTPFDLSLARGWIEQQRTG